MRLDLPTIAAASGVFLAIAGGVYAVKNKPRGEQRIRIFGILDVQTKSFAVVLLVCGCALLVFSVLKSSVATSTRDSERSSIDATVNGNGNIAIGKSDSSTITINIDHGKSDAK